MPGIIYFPGRYFDGQAFINNSSTPRAAYMHQQIGSALVQLMACGLLGAQPLSKPMLGYCQLDP